MTANPYTPELFADLAKKSPEMVVALAAKLAESRDFAGLMGLTAAMAKPTGKALLKEDLKAFDPADSQKQHTIGSVLAKALGTWQDNPWSTQQTNFFNQALAVLKEPGVAQNFLNAYLPTGKDTRALVLIDSNDPKAGFEARELAKDNLILRQVIETTPPSRYTRPLPEGVHNNSVNEIVQKGLALDDPLKVEAFKKAVVPAVSAPGMNAFEAASYSMAIIAEEMRHLREAKQPVNVDDLAKRFNGGTPAAMEEDIQRAVDRVIANGVFKPSPSVPNNLDESAAILLEEAVRSNCAPVVNALKDLLPLQANMLGFTPARMLAYSEMPDPQKFKDTVDVFSKNGISISEIESAVQARKQEPDTEAKLSILSAMRAQKSLEIEQPIPSKAAAPR